MNEIVYFIESGRRRKGEKAKCKSCNVEFIRRLKPCSGQKKIECCTVKCAGKIRRDRIIIQCETCGIIIERQKSKIKKSQHGVFFCSRKCKDFAQSLEGNCKAIQPKHYGTGSGAYSYRAKCKKQIRDGCVSCKEKKAYKLIVHHIDGDRSNNNISNLEVVCQNCHTVRHLKPINNKWIFNLSFLTPRSMIQELT